MTKGKKSPPPANELSHDDHKPAGRLKKASDLVYCAKLVS